jgi:hypothetical protein
MSTKPTTRSYLLEVVDESSNWLVGGGIVTMALFPLALPALILILVAAIPILLVSLVAAVATGLIWLPVHLVRRALEAWRGRRGSESTTVPSPHPPTGKPELAGQVATAGHP